ncbi:small membrane protein YmiC [Cedecea neteri]|nr:small membrane protein YmiC [Cedecea neteri]WPU25203.1 small membrane protein YmiC [Cedecea neteri]
MNNHSAVKYWSWLGAFTLSALFWVEILRAFAN